MDSSATVTEPNSATGLQHFLHYRRLYSLVLLLLLFAVAGITDGLTQAVDVRRWDIVIQPWEIVVWESSSTVVVLALVPAILLFDRYIPLTWGNWRQALLKHLAASVVFSIVHVGGMLMLRNLAYHLIANRGYGFDDWFGQWMYEYYKDVRTYLNLLFLIYAYRFILLRLQGEASELATPESESQAEQEDTYPERFLVKKLGKEFLINTQEIEWLEAQGNYVNLHVDNRAYPLRSTMAAIQERLDPTTFVRVHRSYIINVNCLAEIEPLETGDARLTLRNGMQLQCSRTFRKNLKEGFNFSIQS